MFADPGQAMGELLAEVAAFEPVVQRPDQGGEEHQRVKHGLGVGESDHWLSISDGASSWKRSSSWAASILEAQPCASARVGKVQWIWPC